MKDFKHLTKTAFVSVSILALLFLAYNVVFLGKVPANTNFANLNIAGKKINNLDGIIENYLVNYQDQKIAIIAGNKSFEFKTDELGIKFDSKATVRNINFSSANLLIRLASLVYKTTIKPSYTVDFSKLTETLDNSFADIEKGAEDAQIVFDARTAKIANSQNGVVINRTKLISDLTLKLDSLTTEPIRVSYIQVEPQIKIEQAQNALEAVNKLNQKNIVLTYQFDKWTLNEQELIDLLTFNPKGLDKESYLNINLGDRVIVIKDLNFKGKSRPQLVVSLNSEKIDKFILEIATVVDRPTVDATLAFDGVKVSKFTPAQDGQELDRALVKNLILNTMLAENAKSADDVNIRLPVRVTRAKIANEEINLLGIQELIASGVSYFAGSIPNRIFNIGLGASMISGTLVAPGEVFSFNRLVGAVSAEQGFKQAYVISKGRTVLDDGGGICQVSTTVFRAALNAGLPILERTAHAYRVSYYEQKGFKPGFDATVWSPTVDLKFKNDTDHHILIQTVIDKAQAKLQVDIYGTSDGRKVEISEPVLTNHRPAPEPKYEDDPTLPKGTVKQVDFAAAGLTSVFTRKVYKGNELIIDDTFKSNFRPWQAIYLVGTGG